MCVRRKYIVGNWAPGFDLYYGEHSELCDYLNRAKKIIANHVDGEFCSGQTVSYCWTESDKNKPDMAFWFWVESARNEWLIKKYGEKYKNLESAYKSTCKENNKLTEEIEILREKLKKVHEISGTSELE